MKYKFLSLLFFLLLTYTSSFPQFSSFINKILIADTFNTDHPKEKIFVHYDRPYYQLNDTIWLKGYIVFAKDNVAADSSKIAYIEVINAAGSILKRISTYCDAGLFYSSIILSDESFTPGDYILRSYTNYMRNYGDSSFYKNSFRIINSLVNRQQNDAASKQKPSKRSTRNKSSSLVKTNEGTDLQFMPEGGSFIAGKLQQLGFKALNKNGLGTDVKGSILNSKNEMVAVFASVHKGMGTVWLTPIANETYTAVLGNGSSYKLPVVQSSGLQLQVINDPKKDSIEVIIDASNDLYNSGLAYFFRASATGISGAMGTVRIKDKATHLLLPRKVFPQGICRFTLYDKNFLAVNERIILNWNNHQLRLTMNADKLLYHTRDSIHIYLNATDSSNKPVAGSFSVAVIDTGLVPCNSNADNIISYLALSSELKGNIEDPYYYFDNPDSKATEALMLTQGWVQYNYENLQRNFAYENDFRIKGRVTNILNNPVAHSKLTLFGKDGATRPFLLNAETNDKGEFTFTDFPGFVTDSVSMLINARNRKGKMGGLGVDVALPGYPAFTQTPTEAATASQDSETVQYQQKQEQLYELLKKNKNYLPEVTIKTRIKVEGSKNLNEDGGADKIITKKELETTPKESLLNILMNRLPGFYKGTLPNSALRVYKQYSDIVVFIIDGYNINKQYVPLDSGPFEDDNDFTAYLEGFLRYITAEDVAGIEIMSKSKNTMAYQSFFNMYSSMGVNYVFIEITTYSGNGAFAKKIPGSYLYKPLVPVVTRLFYSPRYGVPQNDSTGIDYRSTVYWNPFVITDKKGKADFSFYSSDNKNGLFMIVQGTDLNGGLGVGYLSLLINKDK